MRLRFTREAARQLDRVLADIAVQSPQNADRVQERIRSVIRLLMQYPYVGQRTERQGIRRIVVSPYPYLLTYRVGDGEIIIRTVRHGARRLRY